MKKEIKIKTNLEQEIEKYLIANAKFLIEGNSRIVVHHIAKHFFELGQKVNCPITASDRGMAEEIIINLKRVEKDYLIDLTKEIEWLRKKVKKGGEE